MVSSSASSGSLKHRAAPVDDASGAVEERTRDPGGGVTGAKLEEQAAEQVRRSSARRGLFFGGLLALQFGVHPILVREFVSSDVHVSSTVLLQEAVKLCLSIGLFLLDSSANHRSIWKSLTLKESLEFAFVPAILYALQNLLIQSGVHHVPFITFNLLNQTKIIATAGCLFLLMGQRQSPLQILALTLLMGGSALLCSPEGDEPSAHGTEFWRGVVPILAATVTSGLAGSLSQMAAEGS
ncbi:hypothetical protein T484DRAFT_1777724 [Baffinella frigidus]|nr:hypothetical protein T484DRAFT_1777724 [Cryptophyta sp. CCMP2293]